MAGSDVAQREVEAVRRFNRMYTQKIGVLSESLLDSDYTLTEVRVLYEIAHQSGPTAADICRALGLDAGYVSRILLRLEGRGLVERSRSTTDKRQSVLALCDAGARVLADLDVRANEETSQLLDGFGDRERARLVSALREVESILGTGDERRESYVLRTHRAGDMGWIVHRHGVLYAREYGWDERFESLVAEIVAKFLREFDPKRERCWIAERNGEIVGSVLVAKESNDVAKLRLLLVEPTARGLGIGNRLVEECVHFARNAGYKKLVLWTNSLLHTARHIYEKTGFRWVGEEEDELFGPGSKAQNWELDL
jgi:DNA-binding MarR family transcriptional regulator/N-acetylglutamate synthase-like GNAT family acetyltransferase